MTRVSNMSENKLIEELLEGLLKNICAKGADAADAIHINNESLSVTQRLGKPEKMERSESSDIGLRVFFGKSRSRSGNNADYERYNLLVSGSCRPWNYPSRDSSSRNGWVSTRE